MPSIRFMVDGGNSGTRATSSSTTTSNVIASPSSSTNVKATAEKEVQKKTKAITEEYMEGVVSLLPNCNYKVGDSYVIKGVGSIFEGAYYFKRVTHSIGADGYSVSGECLRMEGNKIVMTSTEGRPQPIPSTPPKSPSNPGYKYITIKWGDTLWALSKKYKTTIKHLASINNIKNPNLIYAGKKLKVPNV